MSQKTKKKRPKKRRSFLKTFIISMLLFLAIAIALAYAYNTLNKVEKIKITKDDVDLGIDDDVMEDKNVMNILLFGLDEPDAPNGGRSDSIMIASLDKVHKKIKITSLMRDTYVDIPGYGMDKLNHAHSYGGAELAIRTINRNFNMNIRDFAAVDFFGLEKIIDTLGGIEVDISQDEVTYLNMSVRNMNKLDGKTHGELRENGPVTLTGRQAVSYTRIRKTGDGDFDRTERQRFVLEQVIHKGLKAGITQYPAILNTTLPYVTTSISKTEILSLGKFVITSDISEVDKYRLPLNKYLLEEYINGVSYVVPNTLEDNNKALRAYIYDDIKEDNNDIPNDSIEENNVNYD